MAEPAAVLTPITPAERIEVVDILRGVAIFGILVVNMQFFSAPIGWVLDPPYTSFIDRAAMALIDLLFTAKFYTMFSLLFGLGFAVQLLRAEERGVNPVPTYRRRLWVLLLIGIVHAVFIWYGDVLHQYAVAAFFLILFRRSSTRTLIRAAAVSLAIPIVLGIGGGAFVTLGKASPVSGPEIRAQFDRMEEQQRESTEDALAVYGRGSYGEVLRRRLLDLAMIDSWAIFFLPHVFMMFLLGLYAGRVGIFRDIDRHLVFLRKVRNWGFAIGLTGNLAVTIAKQTLGSMAVPSLKTAAVSTLHLIAAPALSLFYVTSIVLLWQSSEDWRRRLAPFRYVGRMPLTNYLLQSIIATTLFYSHGLGLFGKIGPAAGIVISIAIYLPQIPLSMWWMGRFRFGPAEWLWRSLTYGRPQPMLLQAPSPASSAA